MNEVVKKEDQSFMSIIERVATDPDADVHKLEKLLDMQERVMDKQAEIEFNQDMAKLREELPVIIKNKKNSQTNSTYADLDNIKKHVDPLLTKYGFYDRYEDEYPSEGVVKTTCEIVHKTGHSKRNSVQFVLDDKGIKGSANKTAVHAAASSMTYGQRLALCRALGIRISQDDDGNSARKTLPTERAAELDTRINKLKDAKEYKPKFLGYMKVERVDLIAEKDYLKAITAIEAKERNGGANANT